MSNMAAKVSSGWKRGDPIGYIREDIPEFQVPPYQGVRYEAWAPYTLDLQERARLAINALTEPTDPEADYEIYWFVLLGRSPATMQHDWSDQVQCKFLEALPLLRMASGSDQNPHVERRWMEVLLRQLGPDGLAYMPYRGRPWVGNPSDHYGGVSEEDQCIIPFYNGRIASVLTLYAMRDGEGPWRDALRRLVDGLVGLAIDDGHCAYFWPGVGLAVKNPPADAQMPIESIDCEIRTVPLGLVHAYRFTGYEPALSLAGKVNTYLREQFFDPDGTFIANRHRRTQVHFHARTAALLAMLEYAREAGDADSAEFALKGYEYAVSEGETLSGYFPEHLGTQELQTSELCEVADMIALAIKLSEAGVGDYWDDVDRWTRNMFAEGQLIHTDWIARMPEAGLISPTPWSRALSQVDPMSQTTDRVAERNVGAFAG